MAAPVRLALVWHLHQPSYRDGLTGRVLLPWTRLHATKDYRDMAEVLLGFPGVRATFNLTPILLDQVEAVAAGEPDAWLEIARKPAGRLEAEDHRFLSREFFHAHAERMIEPHRRYRELRDLLHPARGSRPGRAASIATDDWRDLQVWFYLAWVDPSFRSEEPVRSLLAKGRGFSEEEKHALLDWTARCAALAIPAYRALAERGQVELSASAYHHPILPLLLDSDAPREVAPGTWLPAPAFRYPEDAAQQVRSARASHARRFGALPAGTWPPEGAVSDAALALLAREGFRWAASDETVLLAALGSPSAAGAERGGLLYRPYEVITPSGPIAMVFRDRALSDLIGFTYMFWEADRAARDFVDRVRRAGERAAGPDLARPLVTVILDGENCWEGYPEDGRPFLLALYEQLARAEEVETVTVSGALEATPPRDRLTHVPVGSWIRQDLGIWIGEAEKNRAWQELRAARAALDTARAGAPVGAAALDAAAEELYAAEASDWFWWYGETHQSAHRAEMDALFRSRLLRAYRLIGATPPPALHRTLRGAGRAQIGPETAPYLRAVIDGRETDFYEWRAARSYDVEAEAGSMHAATGVLKRVRFGVDERHLYLRLDLLGPADGASRVRVVFPDPPVRSLAFALAPGTSGEPDWRGTDAGEPGAFAIDRIVELRVPFLRLNVEPGSIATFHVEVEREGALFERAPRSGSYAATAPGPDFWLDQWSGA